MLTRSPTRLMPPSIDRTGGFLSFEVDPVFFVHLFVAVAESMGRDATPVVDYTRYEQF